MFIWVRLGILWINQGDLVLEVLPDEGAANAFEGTGAGLGGAETLGAAIGAGTAGATGPGGPGGVGAGDGGRGADYTKENINK